jgi:ABC-type transporter Mla subunit MlaD
MEMPCVCYCGNEFDLLDGYPSKKSEAVICAECHATEETEEEINDLLEQLNNAKDEIAFQRDRIKEIENELKDLGYEKLEELIKELKR